MPYFTLDEAATRYDLYRPKVHNIIKAWLRDAGLTGEFDDIIDIACGTGDSTVPLLDIGKNIVGIDQSERMLSKAKEKGINAKLMGYENAHELGQFNLITTCMAFHWFDFDEALEAYKRASADCAIWLIYNYSFGGSAQSAEFNDWFMNAYLKEFPTPPRNKQTASFDDVTDVKQLASSKGQIPITMSRETLIKYLTTQSNIEAKVIDGMSYEEVEAKLNEMLAGIEFGSDFLYNFTYDIYQFKKA